ncbi:hypothetical protein BDZ90DRAFT_234162 [Jaminaea rosea]|uniref:Uncharacterized protein n=1 Tax=Jaminaea rosea TaxID=1569628 RepID=A0A316UJ76_9BASI|nr:hypothetical protein BDZ90DRAFT_234162 [Jaminaea rosea]PWN25316.1 hypothetical protein BDZ90DRAFT_234162 [Jaminaea rosea]
MGALLAQGGKMIYDRMEKKKHGNGGGGYYGGGHHGGGGGGHGFGGFGKRDFDADQQGGPTPYGMPPQQQQQHGGQGGSGGFFG